MEVSVGSDEGLINSFEQIGFEDDFGESAQFSAEDVVAKGKSEENFCRCQVCYDQYKEDNERDLWTVSIKMEDQYICIACQLEKWREFKKAIKVAADKYGFDIVNDETKLIIQKPVGLVFKMNYFEEKSFLKEINQETFEVGKEVLPQIPKKLEEKNSSPKSDEDLEEKKVSTEDDDGIEVIYETDRRCTCPGGNGSARKM